MLTYSSLNRRVKVGDVEAAWPGGSVIEGGPLVLL
jgi:hypothetical protein